MMSTLAKITFFQRKQFIMYREKHRSGIIEEVKDVYDLGILLKRDLSTFPIQLQAFFHKKRQSNLGFFGEIDDL